MNCKPGQMAMIVRPSACEPCTVKALGIPVRVAQLQSRPSLGGAIMELLEGPVWHLQQSLRCPLGATGCAGVDRLPDACLRPFDPDSEPQEDHEGSEPDIRSLTDAERSC